MFHLTEMHLKTDQDQYLANYFCQRTDRHTEAQFQSTNHLPEPVVTEVFGQQIAPASESNFNNTPT
jgi:hypothetical protein